MTGIIRQKPVSDLYRQRWFEIFGRKRGSVKEKKANDKETDMKADGQDDKA